MDQQRDPIAQLATRRILILGLGREGLSSYRFLRRHLPAAPLALADRAPIASISPELRALVAEDPLATLLCGENYLATVEQFDLIIKAPGIVPSLPPLVAAQRRGAVISSNTQLFLQLCPGTVVGTTGTKGKSTTTSAIYAVLAAGGGDVRLVGNIGIPPLDRLEGATAETTFVAELSSHQLADVRQSPQVAVLQNIVPEHLDYYDSFASYVAAKANITRYQTAHDLFLYNAGYPIPSEIASTTKARTFPFGLDLHGQEGCTVEAGWVTFRSEGGSERIMAASDVPLPGRFNLQNVLPAIAIGRLRGLPVETIAGAIRSLRPLEHRLEFVAEVGGVRYYNDSLATVPEATTAALEAFVGQGIVLIAGGYDRTIDYAPLVEALVKQSPRALVLFPPTGDKILEGLQRAGCRLQIVEGRGQMVDGMSRADMSGGDYMLPYARVETMAEAVAAASRFAQPGDVVLLSPASASFVRFKDYRDRGEQFKGAVGALVTSDE